MSDGYCGDIEIEEKMTNSCRKNGLKNGLNLTLDKWSEPYPSNEFFRDKLCNMKRNKVVSGHVRAELYNCTRQDNVVCELSCSMRCPVVVRTRSAQDGIVNFGPLLFLRVPEKIGTELLG